MLFIRRFMSEIFFILLLEINRAEFVNGVLDCYAHFHVQITRSLHRLLLEINRAEFVNGVLDCYAHFHVQITRSLHRLNNLRIVRIKIF